jgi:hypothetical protein
VGISIIEKGSLRHHRLRSVENIRQGANRQEKLDGATIRNFPLLVSSHFEFQAVGSAKFARLSDRQVVAFFTAHYSAIHYRRNYHTHRGRLPIIIPDFSIKGIGELGKLRQSHRRWDGGHQ